MSCVCSRGGRDHFFENETRREMGSEKEFETRNGKVMGNETEFEMRNGQKWEQDGI